ncbi:MAG: hypothetical protein NT030_07425 [Candidatus Saganbacteria bacterium]|nr:hypothetical protein [Candidatus Saganbacteria bacterium]
MKWRLFFSLGVILVVALVTFSVIGVSANSGGLGQVANASFSSPAASESYSTVGKLDNSRSISSMAKNMLEATNGNGQMTIAQYRSDGCSVGCSNGCSNGCLTPDVNSGLQ